MLHKIIDDKPESTVWLVTSKQNESIIIGSSVKAHLKVVISKEAFEDMDLIVFTKVQGVICTNLFSNEKDIVSFVLEALLLAVRVDLSYHP